MPSSGSVRINSWGSCPLKRLEKKCKFEGLTPGGHELCLGPFFVSNDPRLAEGALRTDHCLGPNLQSHTLPLDSSHTGLWIPGSYSSLWWLRAFVHAVLPDWNLAYHFRVCLVAFTYISTPDLNVISSGTSSLTSWSIVGLVYYFIGPQSIPP